MDMPQGPDGLRLPRLVEGGYRIRIGADGTWYYQDSPIERMALVKLFATVLRRDDEGGYWLQTPAERGRIVVDDAPFVAVGLAARGAGEEQVLTLTTNLDDSVELGPDRPLWSEPGPDGEAPRPYILVRDRLPALVARSVYYELVSLAVERPAADGTIELGVWSNRTFFPLGAI